MEQMIHSYLSIFVAKVLSFLLFPSIFAEKVNNCNYSTVKGTFSFYFGIRKPALSGHAILLGRLPDFVVEKTGEMMRISKAESVCHFADAKWSGVQ